jgi:hypothetical protein
MLPKILSAMNNFISSTAQLQNYVYDIINCCSFVLSKMPDRQKISDTLLSLLGCYNVSFVNSLQSTICKIPEDFKFIIMCYFVCILCILFT